MSRFLPYYKYLRVVRWQFAFGVIAGLVYAVASGLGLPLMIKVVFPILFKDPGNAGKVSEKISWYQTWLNDQLGHISHDQLVFYTCLWIPAVFLIRSVASYANSYLIQYSGQRVLEDIRLDLFIKLQQLPISFFKNNKSGDLIARLMNDTAVLKQVVANASSDLIKQPATLVGALGVLAWQAMADKSTFIALIAMVSVPVCILIIRSAGKKLSHRAKMLQKQGGSMTAALSETLLAPLEIRAYNLEQQQISAFRRRTNEILRASMKVVKYRQAISPSIELVAAFGFSFALYLGVKGEMKLNDFMVLFMALFMCYEPIKKLGMIHSLFKQADASLQRIEFISMEPDSLLDPVSPKKFTPPHQAIRFENLSFAYRDEPVLNQLQVTIPIGQVVALVGPSGAGKSTFAHLIPRFYDPQTGAITFDGTDIREFTKKDLRNAIAVVPQTPTLFTGSIAQNIRVGRENATDAEVYEAARRAHAHEFILNLIGGKGYETEVGERGDLLSGGQRQRIAIARAFLKDAPILILDEATSALDSESEGMVQQALAALVKGRTTFIIAHRFSTITIADRILVFENGRIVADGDHESLRESSAIYKSMIGNQLMGAGGV